MNDTVLGFCFVGFFSFKKHMFNFILGLQQVINVCLTGAALLNVDCILCTGKTKSLSLSAVTAFMLYLH